MMPAIKGPREWWESYAVFFPVGVESTQYNETKRAFVAGMVATLDSMMAVGEELSDGEAVDFLDSYKQILSQMVMEMKAEELIQ
jgi:hypothetical protein